MRSVFSRLVGLAALLLVVAGGATLGLRPAEATRTDTSLDGLWQPSSDHPLYRFRVRLSGSLEGGFTISVAQAFRVLDCPISVGQMLMQLSGSGGNTYSGKGLQVSRKQGDNPCVLEMTDVDPITVRLTSPTTLATSGAPGTLTRVGAPKPTPPKPTPKPKPKPKPKTPPKPKPEAEYVKLALDYEIPDRWVDRNGDGIFDYPKQVNPKYWTALVTVHWPGGGGCDGGSYRWTIGGYFNPFLQLKDPKTHKKTCTFSFGKFPELDKPYRVNVQAVQNGRHGNGEIPELTIRDLLIVGLGDSMGSGEGNPDVPGDYGLYGSLAGTKDKRVKPARWNGETRCHRSTNSFQAQAVSELEKASTKMSVTFVHLACSGATIQTGMLHPYGGVVSGSGRAAAQVRKMADLIGNRKIDAVLLSIGVNDVGFSKVVNFCIDDGVVNYAAWGTIDCWTKRYLSQVTLRGWVRNNLAHLADGYRGLAEAFTAVGVKPGQIYIAEYPNPTRNERKQTCNPLMKVKSPRANGWFSRTEAAKAEAELLTKLNNAVRAAAAAHEWHFVRGAMARTRAHGYCVADDNARWFVGLKESLEGQGDIYGTLHPNVDGHKAIAGLVIDALKQNGTTGKPR